MKIKKLVIVTCAALFARSALALEVDPNVAPEINLGGRLIATADFQAENRGNAGDDRTQNLNVGDSSLLFGFSKYLFDDRRYGFAVFGFKLADDDTDLKDDIYVHEAHVGIGGPRYEVKLGRSRLGNTLIQFPTARDDDLEDYIYVRNASSNAEAVEYQQFGSIAGGTWWMTPAIQIDAGITGRTRTNAAGDRQTSADFNGGYVGVAYNVPEAIKIDRGIRFAGVRLDTQHAEVNGLGLPKETVTALIGAVSMNLNDDPESTWNLDLQAIASDGASVPDLTTPAARARAKSRAVVAALRYGNRPALQTRWQGALNVAWKDYADFAGASSYTLAPSYVYRLGSGVEFIAQYRYTHNDSALATALGHDKEQVIQFGLSFAFAHTFNETVGERGSILNLEHNTLDIGPMGGG
ncbi:MAG TPA: porin, partial [Burkholderiales bacterium]|nr:porin [Burkholderiales bacterium]